ncbi:sensor histidine kinase [Cellulosilyticum sp. ST5]|uniref:sensor histidine kinase n=1 Tax=Cellulosilyticum sp. ST5 TaxID=3055805 RepID=UPI00397775FA
MRIIKKILTFNRNMKVKKQLIGIYVIVILIPILIIGVQLTTLMCNMVVDRAINEACVNIERIKERLNEKIKIANSVAESIYVDGKIAQVLKTQFEDSAQIVNTYKDLTIISTYLMHYEEISSIRIYNDNLTLLNNSQFVRATEDIKRSDWYQAALARESQMEWHLKYDEIRKQYYMSLIRALRDKQKNLLGVLVINFDPEKINRIIKDEPYDTMITINGQVVTTSGNSDPLYEQLDHLRELQVEQNKNYKIKVSNDTGAEYIIFTSFTPAKTFNSQVEICMSMSVNSITGETLKIVRTSLAMIMISLGLSGILILIFSKGFSNRIILVRKEMHKVSLGDFNIRKSIEGNDEIGELYEDICQTVESVKQLIEENYSAKVQKEELKRKQKEMQFEMLSSQINPHFLYNTLETIRMKAYCNGETELAGVVKKLSKLLRRNLEVSDRSVSLASELEMIEAYLSIQKFRFGERISYHIENEIESEKYYLLPLLLQPIVENAFIHGLEAKQGSGKIVCSIKEQNHCLKIAISDNGLGISKERLQQIQRSLHGEQIEERNRVGLKNINERIKLYYGDMYGITIESIEDQGTTVTIVLPKMQEG